MIRLAEEEKPDLELTPDIIQSVKSDSAMSHSGVDEAKKTFIEQAKALKPSVDKDLLDELWDKYTQSIKNLPRTIHETFPDFETWFDENKYNLVLFINLIRFQALLY